MIFLNLKREREGREKKHLLGAFFGTSERKSYPLLDNIETSTEKKKGYSPSRINVYRHSGRVEEKHRKNLNSML